MGYSGRSGVVVTVVVVLVGTVVVVLAAILSFLWKTSQQIDKVGGDCGISLHKKDLSKSKRPYITSRHEILNGQALRP
jgi:hypothetical protein